MTALMEASDGINSTIAMTKPLKAESQSTSLETARALRTAGLEVTVVEFFPHLLTRQLDAEGAEVLQSLLEAERDYLHTLTLQPGQGILNNNTLHNRTAFDPSAETGASQRMLYRIRFHNRI